MAYYDPRNDIAFRKVFGTHKRLCISFINALLTLPEPVESIEYMDADVLPATPDHKNSAVDVRCKDKVGRQFIVEMQMYWTEGFLSRTLLNACKAYAEQSKRGQVFNALQPVYAICILNEVFLHGKEYASEYRHAYYVQHETYKELRIDGISFVFFELPKYQSSNRVYRKMADLWLSFLIDVEGKTSREELPEALTADPYTSEAITYLEESSYTPAERLAYDRYWDAVSRERTIIHDGEQRGLAKGLEIGKAEGIEIGRAEAQAESDAKLKEEKLEMARKLKQAGVDVNIIAASSGLSVEEINGL